MSSTQGNMRNTGMDSSFLDRVRSIRTQVGSLPGHSPEIIDRVASRLDMLHFQFTMGRIDTDMIRMTKEDFLAELEHVEQWSFEQALENRNFEPDYQGGDREAWMKEMKLERMEFLLKKFIFLSRLRSDEPEAWDTVNELYYDD